MNLVFIVAICIAVAGLFKTLYDSDILTVKRDMKKSKKGTSYYARYTCPICGDKMIIYKTYDEDPYGEYFIRCMTCKGQTANFYDAGMARIAWTEYPHRPIPEDAIEMDKQLNKSLIRRILE